jgi:hypothetical protein
VDTAAAKQLNEVCAIGGCLAASLFEKDHSADVLFDAWGSEEEIAVGFTVFLGVLNANGGEALANSASALVSSKDTLAWGGDLLGSPDKFLLEVEVW